MSPELEQHLKLILVTKEVPKKTMLLKRGQVCEHVYFIESGMLHCFYEKNSEKITSWFMKENDVIISAKSFYMQTPSEESIVALENTLVHGISYQQLQDIYSKHLEFNVIGRVLTTKYYIQSEERLYSLRKERARDRYLSLLDTQPDIIRRAPLKHVASYLGINMETLSRIRSSI
ncbi:Crp/Fnr family transcriptional regulator [Chitinophaga rhizosphaerae]|uniref:Crp/Fnr family transcriptional regulator n=1 Tax=Chitinophaga rhizosphaerae TaxID=1864947 RepID=UPI00196A29B9|nr:Crp/Fnr family transcriptional regulator [Chitinophaga rhizosphaerae]